MRRFEVVRAKETIRVYRAYSYEELKKKLVNTNKSGWHITSIQELDDDVADLRKERRMRKSDVM